MWVPLRIDFFKSIIYLLTDFLLFRLSTWPERMHRKFIHCADVGRSRLCVCCEMDWKSLRWLFLSCPEVH
jgi:hypothetical protein